MKWSDLTLKERKQIYDAVRAENPNASYFDIKSQFDLIPEYEDGKDNSVVAVYSLPEVNVYPQNRFGDIARSRGYETAKNWQAVKNATTAGINGFANDPRTQFVLAALPIPSGVEGLSDVMNIMKPASKSKQLFYHGSPVRFDKFDAQFIGSAEGGSKAMKGINLWHNSPKNAPKFANIKSSDAPIHLGRSSKPLGGELNPTVYNVIGSDLNLYKTESNRVKSLLQSNLEALKYDGIQTPSQTTVFPGSINKLKIVKKQSIPDFIRSHPEVDKWTQWTTNEELRNLVESNIPAYEEGGKKIMPPKELGLTPGTPEYYKRQQQISGKAELVQPEAYITPAGYIKDAITTAEELEKGNYGNAAVSTLMNAIPWGVGKGLRKIKSRVSNTLNTPIEIHSSMVDEYPSILAEKARSKTSKNKKKVKEESDYDSEFSEVIRRDRNIKKYEKEINKTIEDAVLPDKKTYELVKGIDTAYGTDYLDAYKRIAARDMTNRGKYIKYAELPGNKNAKISRVRDVQDYGPVVDDYVITIDPLQYLPGTANHELGHLADQLASDANNRYLTYLLDEGNIMGPGELRNKGININPNMQAYLLDPSESKSHMLHLKRALVNEGKIHDWSSKVNQNTIEDFLFDPRNTGVVNNANKLQYNMYRNKSRFVDRINNLTPMEFITPLLLPVAGYEINKE
jgi:hypothetical protein